jgi:hypothetical protein
MKVRASHRARFITPEDEVMNRPANRILPVLGGIAAPTPRARPVIDASAFATHP